MSAATRHPGFHRRKARRLDNERVAAVIALTQASEARRVADFKRNAEALRESWRRDGPVH